MADWMKTLAKESSVFADKQTHAQAQATFTAPPSTSQSQAAWRIYVTKIVISASAAPASVVEVTLTGPVDATDAAVTVRIEIPASAFAPIVFDYGTHPLRCAKSTAAVLTLPDLGSGVVGAIQLYGYVGPA